jgi:hypothetical protein
MVMSISCVDLFASTIGGYVRGWGSLARRVVINDVHNKADSGFPVANQTTLRLRIIRRGRQLSHNTSQLCLPKSKIRKEMLSMKAIGSSPRSGVEREREKLVSISGTTYYILKILGRRYSHDRGRG